ncbi:MAG: hypothetical protein HY363_05165 [Candidatus Aenigmarchaeota archaeon]|nr:hypothetical protein [Candidatus Aenigmarchaeota archaeon]
MIPTDRLEALARKFGIGPFEKKKQKTSAHKERSTSSTDFVIKELKDRYVLQNVPYQGALRTVSWSRRLLDKGSEHTQDEWNVVLQGSEWKLPDATLYHATLAALYQHKDGLENELVEKIRLFFCKHFEKHYLMTGSRVMYKRRGNDTVKHHLSGDEKQVCMVGADGWVNAQSGFEDSIDAVVGTRDLLEVENVYEWISGKKAYLWRINNKPNANTERAVVLGVISDGRFNINAGGDSGWPALGVVVCAPKISKEMKVM